MGIDWYTREYHVYRHSDSHTRLRVRKSERGVAASSSCDVLIGDHVVDGYVVDGTPRTGESRVHLHVLNGETYVRMYGIK